MTIQVITLGNHMAGDDSATLIVAEHLTNEPDVDLHLTGRPGTNLLNLLDPTMPTLMLDVVRQGTTPGTLIELRLDKLIHASIKDQSLSSHDLSVADTFHLTKTLDHKLPNDLFLNMDGETFDHGTELTPHVTHHLPNYKIAAKTTISTLKSRIKLQ